MSVVIPTFNRKNVLMMALDALEHVEHPFPFEVIVVDDGSSDGTADALGTAAFSYPLVVLSQQNAGAGAARNAGAAKARGSVLLFLDDDMMADPQLLIELDKAIQSWDAAVGNIPVHPASPESPLKAGLEQWAKSRHDRLEGSNSSLQLSDLLTGQLSVKADLFRKLGGFDEDFNAGGTFGAEDTDFLYRLLASGARAGYAGTAISYQYYVVTPNHYMRQWAQGGRADAALARKHPLLRQYLIEAHGGEFRHRRLGSKMSLLVPDHVIVSWSRRVASRLTEGGGGWFAQRVLRELRDSLYWRNFDDAESSLAEPRLAVLAYHSIGDDASLKPYDTNVDELREHIRTLRARGYSIITLAEAISYLSGEPLMAPSILLSFDDGYESVFTGARTVLSEAKAPAVAFVVSGRIGGSNDWDAQTGRAQLPLMNLEQIRELQRDNWAIASHTRSHPHLTRLNGESLRRELEECRTSLAKHGFNFPAVLAYPFGEHDARVRRAAVRAGYEFAFAIAGGRASRLRRDRFRIQRIEVRGGMTGKDLLAHINALAQRRRLVSGAELRATVRIALPWIGRTSA